jgi:hypothetical protein
LTALKTLADIYRTAYADLVAIAREMWPVLLVLSALFVATTMGYFMAPLLVSTWLGKVILRMLLLIGCAYVAAPHYVALHRFVAFGEIRWIPDRRDYNDSLVYLSWAGISLMLWFAPLICNEVLVGLGLDGIGAFAAIVGLIAIWVLMVRLTTLLPLAALEPRRATWQRALEMSRWRFWFFFIASNGAAIPAMVALFALARAAATKSIAALPFMALAIAALLILQLIPLAVGTRLYQRYASAGSAAGATTQRQSP